MITSLLRHVAADRGMLIAIPQRSGASTAPKPAPEANRSTIEQGGSARSVGAPRRTATRKMLEQFLEQVQQAEAKSKGETETETEI
jgi:hypothetical protein